MERGGGSEVHTSPSRRKDGEACLAVFPLVFVACDRSSSIVLNTEASSLPSLEFEFLAGLHLMILHQLEKSATDAEWDTYLAALAGPSKANRLRCIVITDGASPTRAQRERMVATVEGKPTRVAVISPATAVRFVVSVLALVNRDIRSFSPKEYDAAFSHVGLAPTEYASVKVAIERVHQRLASTRLASAERRRSVSAMSRWE
jgi:hypothetical protein